MPWQRLATRNTPVVRWVVMFAVLLPYTTSVSFSDDIVKVFVQNRTNHFIHAFVDNQPYLYIRPGGSVAAEARNGIVSMRAFYSPGQGVAGSTEQSVELEDRVLSTCNGSNCSTTEVEASYYWTVTDDSLRNQP